MLAVGVLRVKQEVIGLPKAQVCLVSHESPINSDALRSGHHRRIDGLAEAGGDAQIKPLALYDFNVTVLQ